MTFALGAAILGLEGLAKQHLDRMKGGELMFQSLGDILRWVVICGIVGAGDETDGTETLIR